MNSDFAERTSVRLSETKAISNGTGKGVSLPAIPVPRSKNDVTQKLSYEEEEPLQMKTGIAQLRAKEEEQLQMKPFQLKRNTVQMQIPGEVKEATQMKPFQPKSDLIQKQVPGGEEEPLQGKFVPVQRTANTTGLPDNLKSGVENLSGIDISDVKVHYNSAQPAQLQALAYAQGTDIHVGPGQEKHLPHEAWHVVQQKQGRVQPTLQMKEGVAVNDDQGLEHEAEVMGFKAGNFAPADARDKPAQMKAFIPYASATVIIQKLDKPLSEDDIGKFYQIKIGASVIVGVFHGFGASNRDMHEFYREDLTGETMSIHYRDIIRQDIRPGSEPYDPENADDSDSDTPAASRSLKRRAEAMAKEQPPSSSSSSPSGYFSSAANSLSSALRPAPPGYGMGGGPMYPHSSAFSPAPPAYGMEPSMMSFSGAPGSVSIGAAAGISGPSPVAEKDLASSSKPAFVNDIGRLDVGCSVCVAADYKGVTVKQLLKNIFDSKNIELIDIVKRIYKDSGLSEDVTTMFEKLGLFVADESFDNYEAMMVSLTSDDEAAAWTGALAWEGHIIRASGEGRSCSFWDPQSEVKDCPVPKDKKLVLVTFPPK
jgi:hypothetical protein